jgi:transcriptional regulator with XRE-family HTH domain
MNNNRHPYAKQGNPGFGALGQRMKAERIRMGFQVRAFAAETGIDQAQITSYENRGVVPSLMNLIAIAKALDCSLDWLCGLED